MISANNLHLIGQFSVDSGQAIVGDPCYLNNWKTLGKGFGQLGGSSAVAFSTGYGDGLYPVYADINEDGLIGLIVIDFTGEYEVEDN